MSEKQLQKLSSELDDAENTARIRLFEKAAKKYGNIATKAKRLKPDVVAGLVFLSRLYQLNDDIEERKNPYETRSLEALAALESSTKDQTFAMALPGGRFGEVSTSRVFTEVRAILLMNDGIAQRDPDKVRQAIDLFMQIGDEQLFFSRYLQPFTRRVTGARAALECEARAQIIEGEALADPQPSAAVPHYMIAVRALRSARQYDEESRYRKFLTGLRTTRKCWFCGRQVQGASHLVWLQSSISPYFKHLLEREKEDIRIIEGDRLVACQACFNAIHFEAERVADALYGRLMQEIQVLKRRIENLEART